MLEFKVYRLELKDINLHKEVLVRLLCLVHNLSGPVEVSIEGQGLSHGG